MASSQTVIPTDWSKKDAFKDDAGKPMCSLISREFIEGTGRALTHGAKKYALHQWRNGKGITIHRAADALLRHLFAFLDGEDTDKDSGLCHTDHIGACAVFLATAAARGASLDDRWKNVALPPEAK